MAARLAILLAIVVAGVGYIAFPVLQYRVGRQAFPVELRMARAGGLYVGGYVDYRGTVVGRVSALDVSPGAVTARLAINPGVRIPSDSTASIHDLSAVGEEYVDFVPPPTGRPASAVLRSGSVVSVAEADIPLPVGTILGDTSSFASSIDTQHVSSLLDTLTRGLGGTGPQLQEILGASRSLFAQLRSVQPATTELIQGGHTLLDTGQATNPDVSQFSRQLAQFSAQLDASDADLRALFANGTSGFDQLQGLLTQDTASVAALTSSVATVTGVAASNIPAVDALLTAVPVFSNDAASLVKDGLIHGGFVLNPGDPICSYTNDLPLPTAKVVAPVLGRTCASTAPNMLQRGAANAPEPAP
ncbi:MCE family protein [Acidiferrimicrobium sp. IK]|uniref:MCE family protein n=1 Tax=Acidiferrimicrobium sp. IK TaxID=2871700 RepID=UPI0021CB652A|nr:MlaD family protein [Acidiferrimicrobium sp. IK]MCU4187490.1 MCE family protein [Acidiferrimicrobium sp. IK]